MNKDDMALEISMRRGIPMEDVEEVLEEEELIETEELLCQKKKKRMVTVVCVITFMLGVATALCILDKQEKIDIEKTVKKYVDKFAKEKANMFKAS